MIIVPKMLELLHSGFELYYQSIVAVPDVTHGSHVVGGPMRYEKPGSQRISNHYLLHILLNAFNQQRYYKL